MTASLTQYRREHNRLSATDAWRRAAVGDVITVAVRADDLIEGDIADPEQHPIAIALRRQQDGVDDARVTGEDTLVRRGKKWFRYDAPDKQLFKQLQKTLTVGH